MQRPPLIQYTPICLSVKTMPALIMRRLLSGRRAARHGGKKLPGKNQRG